MMGISPNFENGYIGTWTAGFEQKLAGATINAGYVGTAGIKLPAVDFPNGFPGRDRGVRALHPVRFVGQFHWRLRYGKRDRQPLAFFLSRLADLGHARAHRLWLRLPGELHVLEID